MNGAHAAVASASDGRPRGEIIMFYASESEVVSRDQRRAEKEIFTKWGRGKNSR